MTVRASWVWVVEIEGLARAGVSVYTPMAIASEPDPGEAAFSGPDGRTCDEWQALLQPGLSLSGMTYSPLASAPAAQTLSFSVAMPPERPEVEAFFLAEDARPVTLLTAPVDPTDTTIDVVSTAGIAAADVLYIGAECFRVDTVPSATQVTVVNAIPATLLWPFSQLSYQEARSADGAVGRIGHIGSRIAQHDVPGVDQLPPWPDDRVYLQNPRVKGRRVYLRRVSWGAAESGADRYREQLLGIFVIDGVTIGADGTTVQVSATSAVASYANRQLGAKGVKDQVAVAAFTSGVPSVVCRPDPTNESDDDNRRIWPFSGTRAFWSADGSVVGRAAAVSLLRRDTDEFIAVASPRLLGAKALEVQQLYASGRTGGFNEGIDSLKYASAQEVLISDPLTVTLGVWEPVQPFDPAQHPYYSPDKPGGAGVLEHPLHLLLAHLGQLPTNLPTHWQLRVSTAEVDTTGILALAEGPLSIVPRWPGVCVVGPVDALKWLAETFLAPIGCGWVQDEYGRLSVASLVAPRLGPWSSPSVDAGTSTVNTIDVSAALQGRGVRLNVPASAGAVQADTGYGLGKTPIVSLYSDDGYLVADGDPEDSTFLLKAMGALAPDQPSVDLGTLDQVAGLRAITSSIGVFLRRGLRRYVVTIPSSYPNESELYQATPTLGPATPSRYALPGSLVVIDLPGLRGAVGPKGCVVVSHQWSADCATQTIEAMDVGASVRIAAAVKVVSASETGGVISAVVDPVFTIAPSPYTAPPFGTLTEDGQTMAAFAEAAGDSEFIEWTDGTLAVVGDGPGQVLAYDVATNTLTVDLSGSTYVPVAGDFGVLAVLGAGDVDEFFAFMARDRYTI
jgi:hypothetical protein